MYQKIWKNKINVDNFNETTTEHDEKELIIALDFLTSKYKEKLLEEGFSADTVPHSLLIVELIFIYSSIEKKSSTTIIVLIALKLILNNKFKVCFLFKNEDFFLETVWSYRICINISISNGLI